MVITKDDKNECVSLTLYQISCLSFVGAVNFISRWGVDTIMLYWWIPGGIGFGSMTARTDSIYARSIRQKIIRTNLLPNIRHSPLLALASVTLDEPGSAELQ